MIGIDFFIHLAQTWGYLAVFLSGFFSTFTLFLPSPTFIVIFLLGKTLNPFFVGVVGGLGAAIGEMIGYGIGYGAILGTEKLKKPIMKKIEKGREQIEKWFKKYKPEVVIFIFAAAPLLPFDLVGLFCGAIKYDKKKFFIIMLVGKILKYLVLAYAGYYGISAVIGYLG